MKHFYISLIVFRTILAGGFFADRYSKDFINNIHSQTDLLYKAEQNEQREKIIGNISGEFNDKKNILRFFVSAEHIENLKTYIDLIIFYSENSEDIELKKTCIEMGNALENIREEISAVY